MRIKVAWKARFWYRRRLSEEVLFVDLKWIVEELG